ncbi:MAG TPA: hypothetical protein VFI25_03405 [Planctomycetota bacterium]|jgi:hypothetical protein|nr:hypothetical protein [Planctomycetota bacterium]
MLARPSLSALTALLASAAASSAPAQDPAAAPAVPLPQAAEAGPNGARVFNLFSENEKVLRELKAGEIVVVREQQGRDWYRVEVPGGFPCFVHSDFTAQGEKSGTIVVTGSGVNLRATPSSGPGAPYPIGQVGKGTVLRLLEARADRWNRVLSPPDFLAWVPSASVKLLGSPEGHRARIEAAAAAVEAEWKPLADRLAKEQESREKEKEAAEVLAKGDRVLTGLAAKWSPEGAGEARAAFEEVAKRTGEDSVKAAVKDRLSRLEALEALEREKEAARLLREKQAEAERRAAEEISRKADDLRRAAEASSPPPDIRRRFESIGWIQRASAAPASPEFRLEKGGIVYFALSCPSGRYDLGSFQGKEVGIKGKILENEGRVPKMLVIERLEVLSN